MSNISQKDLDNLTNSVEKLQKELGILKGDPVNKEPGLLSKGVTYAGGILERTRNARKGFFSKISDRMDETMALGQQRQLRADMAHLENLQKELASLVENNSPAADIMSGQVNSLIEQIRKQHGKVS